MAMCCPVTECPPWEIFEPRRFARFGATAPNGGGAAAASKAGCPPPRPKRAVWSRSGQPAAGRRVLRDRVEPTPPSALLTTARDWPDRGESDNRSTAADRPVSRLPPPAPG